MGGTYWFKCWDSVFCPRPPQAYSGLDRDANQNVQRMHLVEEGTACTCGHALWPEACLPKTPNRVEIAEGANTGPC